MNPRQILEAIKSFVASVEVIHQRLTSIEEDIIKIKKAVSEEPKPQTATSTKRKRNLNNDL